MRTNIEIDDTLMAEAQKASGHATKKQTLEQALRLMIRLRRQHEVDAAFGKYRWRGSLARSRKGHWYRLTKAAHWISMDEVQAAAPKAKVLGRECVRFEVAGGNYRLVVAFDFRRQIAFVKFIGTHAQYDGIDALTVSRF
jgi:mRNA interferase HigB